MAKKTTGDERIPTHVAFIMDGNGRWAKLRGLPRYLGHKAACERLSSLLRHCRDLGIKATSFFAFSTENWSRPKDEVDHLMEYLRVFFEKNIDELKENGTRILVSGEIDRLPEATRDICLRAIEETKANDRFYFNVCLNYGGRQEIVRAARAAAEEALAGRVCPENIDENYLSSFMYSKGIPDPDLIIRPGREVRISNFLLWQCAYSEFYFTDKMWPEMDETEFVKAIKSYLDRNRRFGGI